MNRILYFLSSLTATLLFSLSAHAQEVCDWVVSGSVSVAQATTEMQGFLSSTPSARMLDGVQIRVRLNRNGANRWRTLSETTTDSLGAFTANGTRQCNRAYTIRVQVRFVDSTMSISGPARYADLPVSSRTRARPWFNIYTDDQITVPRPAGIYALEDIQIFAPTGLDRTSSPPTRNFVLSRHAQIWTIYRVFLNHLDNFGSNFSYPGRLNVKYPHNNVLLNNRETSFANPFTSQINILRGDFDVATLYHEAFHIWAYGNFGTPLDKEKSLDETCLVVDLIYSLNTHDLNRNSLVNQIISRCSAFHEGFAEVAARSIMRELFFTNQTLPLSRSQMIAGTGELLRTRRDNTTFPVPLTSIPVLERHDLGWQSILRTIMLDDLGEYDFQPSAGLGPPTRLPIGTTKPQLNSPFFVRACPEQGLTIRNLLRLFMPATNRGVQNSLRTDDLTLNRFLRRANLIFPVKMRETRLSAIFAAITPSSGINPGAHLCP